MTSLIQKNLNMFWGPPWIVCWSDSSFTDWRTFTNSTKESPTVEVAHFMRVSGIDSVVGWDEESVAPALRVECSHDAQEYEVSLA